MASISGQFMPVYLNECCDDNCDLCIVDAQYSILHVWRYNENDGSNCPESSLDGPDSDGYCLLSSDTPLFPYCTQFPCD